MATLEPTVAESALRVSATTGAIGHYLIRIIKNCVKGAGVGFVAGGVTDSGVGAVPGAAGGSRIGSLGTPLLAAYWDRRDLHL